MTKREDLIAEIDAKSAQLAKIFEEAGPDRDMSKVASIEGDSAAKAAQIKQRNDELSRLGKELDELDELEAVENNLKARQAKLDRPMTRPPLSRGDDQQHNQPKVKTIHDILNESAEYKAFRERRSGTVVFELSPEESKTLIDLSSANNAPTRLPGIVGPPEEERTVRDLMSQGTTDNNALEYYEETANTPAAATRAEGVAKPEAALTFTLRTDNVRKIAVWIPATSESLADLSWLRSYIEARLTYFVKREEEDQLINGDGTPPNISGILDRAIQTQAKGADPTPDAIYKAMQKIRNVGFAEPDAVVLNPNDWTPIRLLRTADGLYIWGSPSEAGPERIFGKTVRQTTAIAENTGLVGAFKAHAMVLQREGISITISTEHASYFIENKVAILAEERLALQVFRPYAFCEVTGI